MKNSKIKNTKSESAIEDEKFIAEFLNGNKESFVKLFKKHYRYIQYALFKSFPNQKETCDDLTQEVMEKLYKKLSQFDSSEYTFSSWLSTIITNHAIDYIRREGLRINTRISIESPSTSYVGVENNTISGSTVFDVRNNDLNPEENYMRNERNKMIRAAINSLDEMSRVLVNLKYVEEKKYEEIVEETQLTLSEVKQILFKARKKLMPQLISLVSPGSMTKFATV